MVDKPLVKHIVRSLTERPVAAGQVTGEQMDMLLSNYVREGYRLHSTHTLGVVSDPEPVIRVMYILVMSEADAQVAEAASTAPRPTPNKWPKKAEG